jgi:hypothetical protein
MCKYIYIYIYIYIYVIKFPSGCPLACANSAFPGDSPTAAEAANSSSCTGPSNNSTAFRRKGRVHVCLWVCAHIESFVSFCKGPDLRRSRLSFLSSLLFFVYTHAHAHAHAHANAYAHEHKHTNTHTHTHKYTHDQAHDHTNYHGREHTQKPTHPFTHSPETA